MTQPLGFSLIEVMLAFSLAIIVILALYKQQWYLQKIVLQLLNAAELLQEKENNFERRDL